MVQMLAGKGHNIILNGFGEPEEIASAMDDCRTVGAKQTEHHGADLCDPTQIESMYDFADQTFGRTPDIVVNNAGSAALHVVLSIKLIYSYSHQLCLPTTGGQFVSPVEDFPTEMYNKIIALNLSAAFHTIRLAVKGMRSRGMCIPMQSKPQFVY